MDAFSMASLALAGFFTFVFAYAFNLIYDTLFPSARMAQEVPKNRLSPGLTFAL